MVSMKNLLPTAKFSAIPHYDHSQDPWFKALYNQRQSSEKSVLVKLHIPPYLKRDNFVPRRLEDFGDGGAFAEIDVAQYPLGMGRKDSKPGSKTLPVTVDDHGKVLFDALVKQGENSSKIVYSRYTDLVPKVLKVDAGAKAKKEMDSDDEVMGKEIEETTEATKAVLEEVINAKLSAAQPKSVSNKSPKSQFIRYKPSEQSTAFNSGAKERIIGMAEMPVDPLEPPKFKHKRVPKGSGSPPVPVMHSPPRPVTVKDQRDWTIPPCISNWKNGKGYTIPLDKRLAADGRGLEQVQINDKFAHLSEALNVLHQKVRESLDMKVKLQKELYMKEKKEKMLQDLATKARSWNRNGGEEEQEIIKENVEQKGERLQREELRKERKWERKREKNLDAKNGGIGKKSKSTRDDGRDISEKIVLGMASTGAKPGEVIYDQRLFNQDKGMDSGFAAEDQYNVYDKGLFTAQPTLSTLYRPKKDVDLDMNGGADEQLQKIKSTDRFKPDKAFTGTSKKAAPRDRSVEFEQELLPAENADIFGLDQLVTEVSKRARAGSYRESNEGDSGRKPSGH